MSILCLVWQDFNGTFHRWEKWNLVVYIDHGSRSKVAVLGWKSPSNDFQDPRKSWGDAQDTEKEEWNEPLDFARLYWFANGGEKPSGSNQQKKGRWISDRKFVQATHWEMVQAWRLKGNWAGKDEAASEMLGMRRTSFTPGLPNEGTWWGQQSQSS